VDRTEDRVRRGADSISIKERTMTTKADFNAEAWASVVEAPLLAGMKLVAAERGGTLRESLAVGKTYSEARRQQGESPLLDEVVATPPGLDLARVKESGGEIGKLALTRLGEAVSVLEGKATPEEVTAYKQFVVHGGPSGRERESRGWLRRHRRQAGERPRAVRHRRDPISARAHRLAVATNAPC